LDKLQKIVYIFHIPDFFIDRRNPILKLLTMKNNFILITLAFMTFALAIQANSMKQSALSEEDLDKISSLGVSVGMWSFAAVFGQPGNIICESSVKSIKKYLDELGVTSYPKALSCNKTEYEAANKLIEEIAVNLTSLKGKQAGDFFRIRCYSITAAFYLSGNKNKTDDFVARAYIIFGSVAFGEALKAAETIGLQAEIIEEGSQLKKELLGLIPEKNKPRQDSSPYTVRLFDWEKKAVDGATDIITN
jgi:hypothetical protein